MGEGPRNVVHEDADSTWTLVPASATMPEELGFDAEEVALVGLKSFKKGHWIASMLPLYNGGTAAHEERAAAG